MVTLQHVGAAAPGPVTLRSDEALTTVDAAQDSKGQGVTDKPDCRGAGIAEQAALTIEGEAYARAYLERLNANTVQPGELAVLVSFLTDAMLYGACRVIEKALGVRHA